MVLNAVQHLTQHPVRVRLDGVHRLLRQRLYIPGLHGTVKVLTQQGCQEGRDQVVDALDIPTGWVPAARSHGFSSAACLKRQQQEESVGRRRRWRWEFCAVQWS